MPFAPPFCPNPGCCQHLDPAGRFYVRHGTFVAACRAAPTPRYRCKSCRRTFSEQTFRQDYRDRKPELNPRLFQLLASGVGFRQSGRMLGIGVSAVQRKSHKIGRQMALLHENLSQHLPTGSTFLLDEEETYEAASIRRVGVAVLIEQQHWFVVATEAGPIRRLAKAGTARRRWQDNDERRHGKRPDESSRCVRTVLQALRDKVGDRSIVLRTDQKPSYGRLARQVFGAEVQHERTSGKDPRTPSNPLFPINTMLTIGRDLVGALRRQSWLVGKKFEKLATRLAIFMVNRNYLRKRFNKDKEDKSAAVHLGLLPRSLTFVEALRWRQDWLAASIHPLSRDGSRRVGRLMVPTT